MKRGAPLRRATPEQNRAWRERSKPLKRGGPIKRKATKKRRQPISPASTAQRAKVKGAVSIVSGEPATDAAHIWPRSLGGCDDALCVVPLTREEHEAYDDRGELDLLPHLIRERRIPELQHALAHAGGSLLRLIERVTNQRWAPVGAEEE